MTKRLHKSAAAICIALKRYTCLLVVCKVDHYVRIPRKDCNIANITICLIAILLVIVCAVVGGVENLVSSIQTRRQQLVR